MRIVLSFSLLAALLLAGCAVQSTGTAPFTASELNERTAGSRAPYQPSPTSSFQRTDGADPFSQPPTERPGLGTAYGEVRASRVATTTFQRANGNVPAAVASLYYNDEDGARTMANGHPMAGAADGARAYVGAGFVSLNVRAPFRGKLSLISSQGRTYAIGKKGERYYLSVHNTLRQSVEVVLSVDGLDVIDGRAASYRKHGYVIEPGETATIEGFRNSMNEVAAFRFSAVSGSYAQLRHGETRNVGVIGMAVFEQAGSNPYTPQERRQRGSADPFPDSRFATPPAR